MKWPILFVTCAIFGFIKEVISFSFITDYLIPRMPIVTKVRSIEDARTLNSNEVVVLDTVSLMSIYFYIHERKILWNYLGKLTVSVSAAFKKNAQYQTF